MINPWPGGRGLAWARADGMAECCGARASEVHHRQPRGMGGVHGVAAAASAYASNLIVMCGEHHRWAESERSAAQRLGWLVRHGQDPAEVPARLVTAQGVGWWLLGRQHGYTWCDEGEALSLSM